MSSFQDLYIFSSQKPWGRSPKQLRVVGEEQAISLSCNYTEREPVLRRLRVTFLGFCLRVIVNEILIDLEKTTSGVLSVILLNLCLNQWHSKFKKPYLTRILSSFTISSTDKYFRNMLSKQINISGLCSLNR